VGDVDLGRVFKRPLDHEEHPIGVEHALANGIEEPRLERQSRHTQAHPAMVGPRF